MRTLFLYNKPKMKSMVLFLLFVLLSFTTVGQEKFTPIASPEAVIISGNVRFTVLTLRANVASVQLTEPIKLITEGQHAFASNVQIENFSGKYETEYTAPESGEIVFNVNAFGQFKLMVNGELLPFKEHPLDG